MSLVINSNKNVSFICLLYPEFFFELVLHLYPGEETKGPAARGVMWSAWQLEVKGNYSRAT